MKKINFSRLLIFLILVFVYAGCKKQVSTSPAPPAQNNAPTISAGTDAMIYLPNANAFLMGKAEDKESNIVSYQWKKIEGPASYTFTDSTQLMTPVTDLVKGYYAFELTVTDRLGLAAKSIVRFAVVDASSGSNEIISHDLRWSCPWDCAVAIENLSSLVPANSSITVFIKRDNSDNWILTSDQFDRQGYNYIFSVNNNTLGISELINEHFGDTPDIKIIY